jgi:hypothetical protein
MAENFSETKVCTCKMGTWRDFQRRLKQGQKVFMETDGTVFLALRVDDQKVLVGWSYVSNGGGAAAFFNVAECTLDDLSHQLNPISQWFVSLATLAYKISNQEQPRSWSREAFERHFKMSTTFHRCLKP